MTAADRSAALALFVSNECRQFRASLFSLAAQLDHEFPGVDPAEFERAVALATTTIVADLTTSCGKPASEFPAPGASEPAGEEKAALDRVVPIMARPDLRNFSEAIA